MGKVRSVVEFPCEYIVLDIETTGLEPGYDEILEIGMIKVRDGKEIDRFSSILHPSKSFAFLPFDDLKKMREDKINYYFSTHIISDFITALTGITNDMVISAPYFSSCADTVRDFIGNSPIVGHNVTFDYRFLNAAFEKNQQSPLENSIICTMRIAKKFFPHLEHHRLNDVCQALGITQNITHRALEDAESTLAVFSNIYNQLSVKGQIEDFIRSFMPPKKYINYDKLAKNLLPSTNEIDETNPLFGKVVVFTGPLSLMSRKDAFQVVIDRGGMPSNTLTKKTNFLVVGNIDFAKSVKEGKTNKMKKAESYQLVGCDISIVSETTFFDILVE
jgi:DNA polymerase III subunit epsilon